MCKNNHFKLNYCLGTLAWKLQSKFFSPKLVIHFFRCWVFWKVIQVDPDFTEAPYLLDNRPMFLVSIVAIIQEYNY